MEIDRRISLVQIMFVQIASRTKHKVLNFGYIMGEVITFQPNLKPLNRQGNYHNHLANCLTLNFIQIRILDDESIRELPGAILGVA